MASNLSRVLSGMEETVITATDQVITVDPDTRQLNIPGIELVFGVEGDADSERKYFQFPRYVGDNLDLAGCFLRVSYRNANGDKDFSPIDDVALNGDSVVFSWKIHPKVVAYKGQVRFVVCAVGPDLKVKWHTTLGVGISAEGMEPDANLEATEDGVAALIAMVEAQTAAVETVGETWVGNVKSEGATQVAAVKTAAEDAEAASVAEIEAKGVNTRNSIPEDYTALSEAVDALNHTRGAAIVCEAAGSAVAVNDASDLSIQGLRIFGRSTQDGTPTPEAPVEIKSVENPVVRVCGKNLIPYPYTFGSRTMNGVTFTDNGDGSITANGTATAGISFHLATALFLPAGRYVFSGCPSGGSLNTYRIYYSDNVTKTVADYGNTSAFTLDSDFTGQVVLQIISNTVVENLTFRPMIRLASIEDDIYEPYSGQNLSTTHTLSGIPVTSGGNYTDNDGQQWICDEIDLERGVYVRRVKQLTLDGSEAWKTSSGKYIYMRTDEYAPKSSRGFCSCVPYKYSYEGDGIFAIENTIYLGAELSQRFNMDVTTWTNILTESPATLLYNLATPIETTLSETEIAAYRALHSNYPNTTVLNDCGAHMVVKYAADTKLYIDNKIAALVSGK